MRHTHSMRHTHTVWDTHAQFETHTHTQWSDPNNTKTHFSTDKTPKKTCVRAKNVQPIVNQWVISAKKPHTKTQICLTSKAGNTFCTRSHKMFISFLRHFYRRPNTRNPVVHFVFMSIPTGRSGKTNGIVIEAKMRAGRRRKLFRQETGWREPNYAGVSII
jgi:hypothetical protein